MLTLDHIRRLPKEGSSHCYELTEPSSVLQDSLWDFTASHSFGFTVCNSVLSHCHSIIFSHVHQEKIYKLSMN